jgi:hypothetical protein
MKLYSWTNHRMTQQDAPNSLRFFDIRSVPSVPGRPAEDWSRGVGHWDRNATTAQKKNYFNNLKYIMMIIDVRIIIYKITS